MRLLLTDLTIQRLKTSDRQLTYWDENLPGFGLRVSKRTKSFVIMHGKERKLTTFGRYPDTTLKNARQEAKKALMAQSTHRDPNTYPDAVLAFLDDAKGRIESATYGQYDYYLNFFGFQGTVAEIGKADIKAKLEELKNRPTAQNMAYSTLRAFFNWCLRHEYIDRHPLTALPVPNRLQSRERVLSDDELKAIWDATTDTGSPGTRTFNRIVRVLILTGQRRMEIASLTAEPEDTLTFFETKNKQTHTIPITPLVKEHLPIAPFNDWSGCKFRLDKKCGITNWVIHDLRRTFSTNCAKLGIPIHITERILNHSGTVSGIVKVYNRYSYMPEMKEALLTYEAHIRKLIGAQSIT